MIIGVMQPYFLPYFEYFRLINACDRWVVFDVAQFTRKTWMSRNRILNRENGTSYISIPVKHTGAKLKITDAQIDNATDWHRKLFDQLRVYASEAPHYRRVIALLDSAIQKDQDSLCSLNVNLMRAVCAYLDISTPVSLCSEMNIEFPPDCGAGEWALHVAINQGATEYRNPSGGRELFDPQQFASHGISLSFHQHSPRTYQVGRFRFVSDLSIVDYLMWNDPTTLKAWLQ